MADVDHSRIFEQSSDVLLVLLPDEPRYTIAAATYGWLVAMCTTRERIIGRGLFEVVSPDSHAPLPTGACDLRASLGRVLATTSSDTMAMRPYDIHGPDGSVAVRHGRPTNIPVLSEQGDVRYILHRVEDVTDRVRDLPTCSARRR
jgi:hypothetical protein